MKWYKCTDKINENEKNVWNNLETWKDEDELEPHLVGVYKDASVGERKGMKQHVIRFTSGVDELLNYSRFGWCNRRGEWRFT